MSKMYTIAEFRKNSRQILNEAILGPITITRYDEIFVLLYKGQVNDEFVEQETARAKVLAPATDSSIAKPPKRQPLQVNPKAHASSVTPLPVPQGPNPTGEMM